MFSILIDTTLFGTSFPLADKILKDRFVKKVKNMCVRIVRLLLCRFDVDNRWKALGLSS